MAAEGARRENLAERHAWKVFTALSLLVVLFGVGDIVQGGSTFASGEAVLFNSVSGTSWDAMRAADPAAADVIDYLVRAAGVDLVVVGLLSLSICLTALRRGDRWAWFAMLAWPFWAGLAVVLVWSAARARDGGIPVPIISGTIIVIIAVATLALSYRKYVRSTS